MLRMRIFNRMLPGVEILAPPSRATSRSTSRSSLRMEAAAVYCTELRRRASGDEGANSSSTLSPKSDMALLSADCSSSGLAFST